MTIDRLYENITLYQYYRSNMFAYMRESGAPFNTTTQNEFSTRLNVSFVQTQQVFTTIQNSMMIMHINMVNRLDGLFEPRRAWSFISTILCTISTNNVPAICKRRLVHIILLCGHDNKYVDGCGNGCIEEDVFSDCSV